MSSSRVKEFEIDYTYCKNSENITCASIVNATTTCKCVVPFTITEDFDNPTYMYYGLTNYFQNHRRYVKSRDDAQLYGGSSSPIVDCDPLQHGINSANMSANYAPCGLIANSLFNDTIILKNADTSAVVPVTATGIAWPSDVEKKFNNPSPQNNLTLAFAGTITPPNWNGTSIVDYFDNPEHPNGAGYKNEDFIVWMRTAALPNFRKLYRKLNSYLLSGNYNLEINYRYPTAVFSGHKKIIFSTTSWMGGKNDFLGIVYIIVGILNLVAGLGFLIKHCVSPRALGDPKYLRWATN